MVSNSSSINPSYSAYPALCSLQDEERKNGWIHIFMYRLTGTGHRAQVHADFHEMGVESTFFFAPGADPWNKVITPWQHEFHKLMGNGNATLFNEKFRLYFTKKTSTSSIPAMATPGQ